VDKNPKKPRKGGRPSKLTPELEAALLRCAGNGLSARQAAHTVGLPHSTLDKWLHAKYGPYARFREAWQVARVRLIDEMADALVSAARSGEWRAALAILERRDPKRWAKRPQPLPTPVPAVSADEPLVRISIPWNRRVPTHPSTRPGTIEYDRDDQGR